MDSIDYWGNKLPKCPHCAADFQVWEGDNPLNLNYGEGGSTTFECRSCFKDFVCVTAVSYAFSTAVSEEAADDDEWGPQTALSPDLKVQQHPTVSSETA